MARNNQNSDNQQTCGCSAWFYHAGRSLNKRWGRAVNRLRSALCRDNAAVAPTPKVDENASPELLLTRRSVSRSSLSQLEDKNATIKAAETQVGPADCIDSDRASMTSSVISALATAAVKDSLTNVVHDLEAESVAALDKVSMTSSVISAIADAAVAASLTSILNDANMDAMSPPLTSTVADSHISPDLPAETLPEVSN